MKSMFANLPFDNAGDKQQLTIALTIVFASGGATITNDLRPIPRTLIAPGRLIQHQSLTTNEYLSAGTIRGMLHSNQQLPRDK